MKDKKNNDRKSDVKNKKQNEEESGSNADDKSKVDHDFFEQWKHPEKKNMGNDISSEIKIANSGGEREGGTDKRWHMEDNDERKDQDDKIGN